MTFAVFVLGSVPPYIIMAGVVTVLFTGFPLGVSHVTLFLSPLMNFHSTLSRAHLGYLYLVRTFLRCCNSLFKSSGLVHTVLALWVRVLITLYLAARSWWLSHCKYWSVWISFLYTVSDMVLPASGSTKVSRNGIAPFSLLPSTVNLMTGSTLLICSRKVCFCPSCWITNVSSTYLICSLGVLRSFLSKCSGHMLVKHTKSHAHEAKGYYPLSLRCLKALFMLLTYNSLFLVCRSICTSQPFPSSRTESETPLLSPTQAPLGTWPIWVLRHWPPLSLMQVHLQLEGSRWVTTGSFHITTPMKHTKSQAHEAKGYYPLSL